MDEVLMSEMVRFQGGSAVGRRGEKCPLFHDLEGWVEGKSSVKLHSDGIKTFGWEEEENYIMREGSALEEILGLLKKLELRIKGKTVRQGTKKAKVSGSKLERELQKLEFLVNYKTDLRMVRSLGVGKCLDWGAMDARGQAGGIVVFWDKWVLEFLEMETVLTEEMEDFWAELGENSIKEGMTGAFQMFLSETGSGAERRGAAFNSLSPVDSVALEDYWDVVKDEVLGFFGDFYELGCFERSLNVMFVVLVPKKSFLGGGEGVVRLAWLGVIDKMSFGSKWLVGLDGVFLRAKDGDFIEGFQVKERNDVGVEVSHLFFADDTLIFCDASKENLEYLSWVFMWFKACLGLPLGAPYKSSRVWEGVVERFQKRLPLWKRQYLSKVWVLEAFFFNRALLGKWSWRFVKERYPLWKWVVVGKCLGWGSGLRFIRQFNDWELEEVDVLFGRLHNYSIVAGTFDAMVWLETKDDDFSVQSFHSLRQVGEWSLSHIVRCGNFGSLLEIAFLLGRVLVLALMCLVDRLMYGSWILVPLNFLKFNFLSSGGDYYGTHKWHWYFTQGFPVMLFTFLPFSIAGMVLSKQWKPSGLIAWVLGLYSVLAAMKTADSSNSKGKDLPTVMSNALQKCIGHLFLAFYKHSNGFVYELVSSGAGQRGTEDVMNYLSKEASNNKVKSILFLMPCHATPYYSTLHHDLPMRFLDCSPSEEKGTLDESDRFMMDPANFASEFAINWSLPSHIVMFDSEERSLREFLVSHSFKEIRRFFHAHLKVDRDLQASVVVYAFTGQ
ncbi:GPI mannosyltransferase 3 [Vitis vinifera]|uniref:Mannosyltransferase n=1 Tax=Vitis vinifera TaxID=29760 RepID=A0A438HVA1_VITVI|nr:GPI mannosyltransferase 3 [Vitis vinifera]